MDFIFTLRYPIPWGRWLLSSPLLQRLYMISIAADSRDTMPGVDAGSLSIHALPITAHCSHTYTLGTHPTELKLFNLMEDNALLMMHPFSIF